MKTSHWLDCYIHKYFIGRQRTVVQWNWLANNCISKFGRRILKYVDGLCKIIYFQAIKPAP